MAGREYESITIHRSVAEIDRIIWESLNTRKKICLSYGYLKAMEEAPPSGMEFRYAVIGNNGQPAGIAVFQLLPLRLRIFSGKITAENVGKRAIPAFSLLFCGNSLISGEYAYSHNESISNEQFIALLKKAARQVKRNFHHRHIIGTVIKDIAAENPDSLYLRRNLFAPFSLSPNMVIRNLTGYQDLALYISSMKGKYRSRVRSVLKKGSSLERRELDLEEIIKNRNEIFDLYLQVHNRSRFRITSLNPRIFEELKRNLGSGFTLSAYYEGDTMAAFTTRLFSKGILEGYTHGLNYSDNKRYEIYQNILLDDIKEAINRRIDAVAFGRTSIAMKSSLGAVPEPLTFYVRCNMPLHNHLLIPHLQKIKPEQEYCRNPFA